MTNHDLQPVEHFLTGPAEQLANVLRAADARGHLVRYGRPQSLGGGRYAIGVTLLEPVPRPRWYQRIPWKRVGQVAAVVAGLTVLGGLGWGAWLLIAWISAHLTAVIVTGVLVLIVVGAVSASRESHCHGCGGR
ncbi:hypothetical protein ACQP1P_02540 [Dactylosporangium sp. CA-052675]|uniref:hypothetical protein n=1 Tax=Dactylosporangium sp. CA-052675 TaxID=3239927 RepID=UPI003D912C07